MQDRVKVHDSSGTKSFIPESHAALLDKYTNVMNQPKPIHAPLSTIYIYSQSSFLGRESENTNARAILTSKYNSYVHVEILLCSLLNFIYLQVNRDVITAYPAVFGIDGNQLVTLAT